MLELYRLVYMSRANRDISNKDVEDILNTSRSRNHKYDVTGLLLFASDSFIQILEGPQQAVEEIFRSITADGRHSWIVVLLRDKVERRSFPEWTMGFERMSQKPNDPTDLFELTQENLGEKLQFAPPGVRDIFFGFADGMPERSLHSAARLRSQL